MTTRFTAPSLAMLVMLGIGAPAARGEEPQRPIAKKGWRSHPAIAAIRSLVEANEQAIAAGAWRKEGGEVCASKKRAFGIERWVTRDQSGRIRKYVVIEGTDDSAYSLAHHYDAQGRLRFAYGTAGAVNGSAIECRLYFSEDGRELWRDRKTKGPGYTFLPDQIDKMLVRDPAKDLESTPNCE